MTSGVAVLRARWRKLTSRSGPLHAGAIVLVTAALMYAPVTATGVNGAKPHRRDVGTITGKVPYGGTLFSVSCPTAAGCAAVGDKDMHDGPHRLADLLRTSWRSTPTPLPRHAVSSLFSAVNCPWADRCMAVGSFYTRAGVSVPFTQWWNGRSWRVLRTPAPADKGGTGSALTGVNCRAPCYCIAVGSTQRRGTVVTLAELWNGVRWRIMRAVNVRRAGATVLAKVSCSHFRACTAVGMSVMGTGQEYPLAERFNGARWQIQPAVSVRGVPITNLFGVSCPAARFCVAVGTYGGTATKVLTEFWNGARWRVLAAPRPARSVSSALSDVSCRSQSCTAVGSYRVRSGHYATLIEVWNGGTWRIRPSPNRGMRPELFGVSCASPRRCVAVGGYARNPADLQLTLTEVWNGRQWRIETAPG